MVGRVNNDMDVNALEEELAALMLQDNGEPLPPFAGTVAKFNIKFEKMFLYVDAKHSKPPAQQQQVRTNTTPVSELNIKIVG